MFRKANMPRIASEMGAALIGKNCFSCGGWVRQRYLTSPGRPTKTGLQLDKACYPCSM